MNVFQTIWTALTTENEMLSVLLSIPISFLETAINMFIFIELLKFNATRKQKIKYILFSAGLCDIIALTTPNPYKSFINLIIIFLCIKFIFNTRIAKSIIATLIPILFSVLGESIATKLLSSIVDFNSLTLISVPIYRFSFTLLIQFFNYHFYLIIKYFKIQIALLENMNKKSKIIFLSNLALAVLAICIQFLITGFYLNRLPIYIVIFSNVSLILYFLLSLYSLAKTTQLEVTSLDLEQEKEHNKILKSLQDDLHGFRHDFSNIMCTIGGYVQVKDINGLGKYYSEIRKDINKVNNLGALNPEVINSPAVYALISSKYEKTLELGIEMNINIFLDLNILNMKIYEFTRVLGILLDNAIEAAKECDDKIINLEIRRDSKRNRQILLLENTYKDKNIDTNKIFEKNYSTKEGNSGLGLWEVRQILKRNNNLNLFTTHNDKFFKQQLEMYNIQK